MTRRFLSHFFQVRRRVLQEVVDKTCFVAEIAQSSILDCRQDVQNILYQSLLYSHFEVKWKHGKILCS